MSADEFLEWDQFQDRRHELVDRRPVAMQGRSVATTRLW
jgi:hypothetical protein